MAFLSRYVLRNWGARLWCHFFLYTNQLFHLEKFYTPESEYSANLGWQLGVILVFANQLSHSEMVRGGPMFVGRSWKMMRLRGVGIERTDVLENVGANQVSEYLCRRTVCGSEYVC